MSENHARPYDNVTEVVGGTPLVRLNSVTQGVPGTIYAKCEFMNPGGSVKDRIGLAIVEKAEREGALKPGGVIVEATSGNTGLALAMVAAIRANGVRVVLVESLDRFARSLSVQLALLSVLEGEEAVPRGFGSGHCRAKPTGRPGHRAGARGVGRLEGITGGDPKAEASNKPSAISLEAAGSWVAR